jgi:hypothetical protein
MAADVVVYLVVYAAVLVNDRTNTRSGVIG